MELTPPHSYLLQMKTKLVSDICAAFVQQSFVALSFKKVLINVSRGRQMSAHIYKIRWNMVSFNRATFVLQNFLFVRFVIFKLFFFKEKVSRGNEKSTCPCPQHVNKIDLNELCCVCAAKILVEHQLIPNLFDFVTVAGTGWPLMTSKGARKHLLISLKWLQHRRNFLPHKPFAANFV